MVLSLLNNLKPKSTWPKLGKHKANIEHVALIYVLLHQYKSRGETLSDEEIGSLVTNQLGISSKNLKTKILDRLRDSDDDLTKAAKVDIETEINELIKRAETLDKQWRESIQTARDSYKSGRRLQRGPPKEQIVTPTRRELIPAIDAPAQSGSRVPRDAETPASAS